jgi:hypothetical protein
VSERWRRPANVIDIEQVDQGIWLPDGRVQGAVRIAVDEETAERIRTGHMCAKCLEPLEIPWPVHCPVCGAPVRERQAEFLAQEFGIEKPFTRLSWEDELASLSERVAKEKEKP